MRLKRIELFGFKSFADRTALEFPHELTGIVGPNGCGKSNVVDAVRWVLGETRPTSMRGEGMSDVVFKGSASRPPLGVAEVTLVLDNGSGAIPTHGAEVAITRRVFRSGEGEYEIDGQRVRLKDVKDLLFDTGLGSRGYSVLEQGRIDAVLSANPKDRRAIFEEAAGVSRFRQRRRETEQRLGRVDQDLERLDDVLGELESRTRSLKIQAGKAERYTAVRDGWRAAALRYSSHRLAALDAGAEHLRAEHSAASAGAEELRAAREEGEGEVRRREREQETLVAELERVAGEASHLAGELRAMDERRHQLTQRVESWRVQAQAEAQRSRELEQRGEARRAEWQALSAEAAAAAEEHRAMGAEEERVSAELRALEGRRREARQASEQCQKVALEWLQRRTEAEHRARSLEASLAPLAERRERAAARLGELEGRARDLFAEAEAAQAEREAAEAARGEAQGRVDGLEAELEALSGRAAQLAEARKGREVERARLRARIEGLRDFSREREGLEAGARALLSQQGSLAEALDGLLADHLNVPTHLARALDVALGEAAQALVLRDAGRAHELSEWLRSGEVGQARFALPSLWGAMAEDRRELPAPLSGIALPLSGAVQAEAGFAPLLRWLLADCLLVDELAVALELAPRHPDWRFVTPEGDLVDAGGLVTGWREVTHGAVGRRAEAAELEARAEALEEELAELATQEEQLFGARAEGVEAMRAARGELEDRRARVASAQGRAESARARATEAQRGAEEARRESGRLEEELVRAEAELERAREARAQAAEAFEEHNRTANEAEAARQELEAEREVLARADGRVRVERSRLAERSQGLAQRVAVLARGLEEADLELQRSRRVAAEASEAAETARAEVERLAEERDGLLARRGELDETLGHLREREREGRTAIESLRRRVEAATGELEARFRAAADLELELQRVVLSIEELERRVAEELELDREALLAQHEPDPELADAAALETLGKEVHELRRQLERLGPVNLEAVSELEDVSTRLEFLTGQRKDLAESKAELLRTLTKINSESERLFAETFEEIRGNFRAIFRQLFGGGNADIALVEGEPVLEAGIEISAQPPGRQRLPIGLLSGGQRTMTALALLFAVFQARPSPFCVLDEVDAALDDANVARFLAMLDGFRQGTQFIVVTHNKGTMAACQLLYGITMETKGVSRQVSVELEEVDRFVPEATGRARAKGAAKGALKATAVEARGEDEAADDAVDEAEADAEAGSLPTFELEPAARRQAGEAEVASEGEEVLSGKASEADA